MTDSLLASHEKEYLLGRPPKNFVHNGTVKVGGFGKDTSVKQEFHYGNYQAAANARRNLNATVRPLIENRYGESDRYRLVWG